MREIPSLSKELENFQHLLVSPQIFQGSYDFETLYIQNDKWLKITTLAKKALKILLIHGLPDY